VKETPLGTIVLKKKELLEQKKSSKFLHAKSLVYRI
jgi:hypothetical protein